MNESSDTEVSNPAQTDTAADRKNVSPPIRKKRKWLRRFIWLVIIFGILGWLINGLITRKVVHHFLNNSLQNQRMYGSVEIRGTLLSGLSVHDLDYKDGQGIEELSIDQATVEYRIMELIKGKIDGLKIDRIRAQIDIAQFKSVENPKEPATTWQEKLNNLRPLFIQPEITINDLDLSLKNNGKKIAEWKLASLQHDAGSSEIKLNQWLATNGVDLSTPKQDAVIVWQENGANLDKLEIVPDITFQGIQLDWQTTLSGKSNIILNDAVFSALLTDNAYLKLESGELTSKKLLPLLKTIGISLPILDAEAVISDFQLTIPVEDFKHPVAEWDIDGDVTLKSGRWETYTVKNTRLNIHQENKNYRIKLDGIALSAPFVLNAKGTWTAPTDPNWWDDTRVKLDFQTQASNALLALIPDYVTIPKGIRLEDANLKGHINTNLTDLRIKHTKLKLELSGAQFEHNLLPKLQLDSTFEDGQNIIFNLVLDNDQTMEKIGLFQLNGKINIDSQKYAGKFALLADTNKQTWITPLAKSFKLPATLEETIDIKWDGSGDILNDEHQGQLMIRDLVIKQPEQAVLRLNTTTQYDWPNSLDIAQFTIQQEELMAQASLVWDGKEAFIRESKIIREGELIANIKGQVPYSSEVTNLKEYFAQELAWDLSVETETLRLDKIAALIPDGKIPNLKGSIQTNLKLSGTPKNPTLKGLINIDGMNDIFDLGLEEISVNTNLKTEGKLLNVKGDILENNVKRLSLNMALPFTPYKWLEDDNLLMTIKKNSKLRGTAEIKRLPLGRFKKLIPEVEKLEGLLDAKAVFKGTIDKPEYTIDFNADLPIIGLKNIGIDDIKNLNIKGQLDQNMIAKGYLTAKLNGGKFVTNFTINVNDPDNPVFDVNLSTNYALIYRNEVLAARANANLKLKGNLEDAFITGDIGIVESLFYKDIDLIPIGVPSSAIGSVTLPSLNSKAANQLPIPAPFDQWKLNLTASTMDPILIRGNIGNGNIQGSVKITGTLAKPSIDGTLKTNRVRAKLPFSVLAVDNGKIIFKPGRGFIPYLEIKGKSQIGTHNVNLYVYGSAADPKVVLSSIPALPENEIMTLLATGTTNSGLANRDVATFKTLQILLLELKQRNDRPEGNRLFGKILSGIDDLDLKIGELNQLTGEKYASARVKLHDRWYLTAQLDSSQPPQTRGLIMFALRFR